MFEFHLKNVVFMYSERLLTVKFHITILIITKNDGNLGNGVNSYNFS